MRMDKRFFIELVDSFTNRTSTHFSWTKLSTDDMLSQMRDQMTASTLVFLVMSGLVLIFVIGFIIREIHTLLHLKDLKTRVVLITGGASGIGRLIAKKCCHLGSIVVIWDINEEWLEKTVSELSSIPNSKIYGYKVDITDYNKVYETADKMRQDIGSTVDVLINNAGIVVGKNLLNSTEKELMLTMNVNTLSHFWTVKAFLPDMIQKKEGHIVTVASACGVAATSGMPDYVASKFAAVGFNDALRLELKQNPDTVNIKTLCVCPYYVNTGMFTGVKNGLLPLLEPEYVADRIVNSVQRCDEMLIMPWMIKTSYLFKFLVPIWVQDLGLDVFGISRSMHTFKGRTVTIKEEQVTSITSFMEKKIV